MWRRYEGRRRAHCGRRYGADDRGCLLLTFGFRMELGEQCYLYSFDSSCHPLFRVFQLLRKLRRRESELLGNPLLVVVGQGHDEELIRDCLTGCLPGGFIYFR